MLLPCQIHFSEYLNFPEFCRGVDTHKNIKREKENNSRQTPVRFLPIRPGSNTGMVSRWNQAVPYEWANRVVSDQRKKKKRKRKKSPPLFRPIPATGELPLFSPTFSSFLFPPANYLPINGAHHPKEEFDEENLLYYNARVYIDKKQRGVRVGDLLRLLEVLYKVDNKSASSGVTVTVHYPLFLFFFYFYFPPGRRACAAAAATYI